MRELPSPSLPSRAAPPPAPPAGRRFALPGARCETRFPCKGTGRSCRAEAAGDNADNSRLSPRSVPAAPSHRTHPGPGPQTPLRDRTPPALRCSPAAPAATPPRRASGAERSGGAAATIAEPLPSAAGQTRPSRSASLPACSPCPATPPPPPAGPPGPPARRSPPVSRSPREPPGAPRLPRAPDSPRSAGAAAPRSPARPLHAAPGLFVYVPS